MSVEQSLREGNLTETLALLQEQVRKDPSNSKHRIFLFQLLSVVGQWDRAMTQLNVIGEMDSSALMMVQAYREALRCEVLRAEIFAGKRSPLLFGEPEPWVALMMEALRLSADGRHADAQGIREQAFEDAPATPGSVDGQSFQWLADADSRLGPILEAVVNGSYYLIPFHRIRSVQFEGPSDLRDVVWTPAQFTWANGGQTVGLVPTRYPGAESSDDPQLCLARKTEWQEPADGVFIGQGQRMLATDVAEFPLMDLRQLQLDG